MLSGELPPAPARPVQSRCPTARRAARGQVLALVVLVSSCLLRRGLCESYCPITVSYEVSLGQAPLAAQSSTGGPQDFADIPIFFAKIGVFSNNVRALSCHLRRLLPALCGQ